MYDVAVVDRDGSCRELVYPDGTWRRLTMDIQAELLAGRMVMLTIPGRRPERDGLGPPSEGG